MASPNPPPPLEFVELAHASKRVAATSSRLEKKQVFIELLARVPPREIEAVVGWLVGEPLCGPLGVGPAHLWEMSRTAAPDAAQATVEGVEEALRRAPDGGREQAVARVAALFARLTEPERAFFVGALTGNLRQGSLGGVMLLALVDLSGRPEQEVRRTVMVTGSIARAARALLGPGREEPPPTSVALFHPLAPMLASPAETLKEALEGIEAAVVEWKIDGVRVQVHKEGGRVSVYSRQGNDITAGCEPVLDRLAALDAEAAVIDGEIALEGPGGEARAFQDSFSAVASKGALPSGDRLRLYLFDCLHKDGRDLLDEPLSARLEAFAAFVPPELRVRQLRTASADEAEAFYAQALAAGHEGVVVKDLGSPYRFGARGRAWQKVKEFATADLVVLAAEWGSGRRTGYLSNLHLGAREAGGGFCMVGKTFKGLTDALLQWQTAKLQELATERTAHVVFVRPELVVEIRYSDVQRSPRYPGGIALRFARVERYREEKAAGEAELLADLVAKLPEPARAADARPAAARRKKRGPKNDAGGQLSLFGPTKD
ncbi:MAG TPA: ATP-dependent DNA ligase [Polyangiaceae bacterium]|jgi:DNA ligase-1